MTGKERVRKAEFGMRRRRQRRRQRQGQGQGHVAEREKRAEVGWLVGRQVISKHKGREL